MNLFERIKSDRIESFKTKNNIKKDLLGCVISESSKDDKNPTDSKVISTIKKFISNNDEVIANLSMNISGTPVLNIISKHQLENDILNLYLPKQLQESEYCDLIINAIENGKSDIKSLNQYFKDQYDGRYNSKFLNEKIKEVLNATSK